MNKASLSGFSISVGFNRLVMPRRSSATEKASRLFSTALVGDSES